MATSTQGQDCSTVPDNWDGVSSDALRRDSVKLRAHSRDVIDAARGALARAAEALKRSHTVKRRTASLQTRWGFDAPSWLRVRSTGSSRI